MMVQGTVFGDEGVGGTVYYQVKGAGPAGG